MLEMHHPVSFDTGANHPANQCIADTLVRGPVRSEIEMPPFMDEKLKISDPVPNKNRSHNDREHRCRALQR